MSTYYKPLVGPNEAQFEMSGHLRVLCPTYLPRKSQKSFFNKLEQYKTNLGRKVNETLVFHETAGKHHTSQNGLRRNLTMASTMSPEM